MAIIWVVKAHSNKSNASEAFRSPGKVPHKPFCENQVLNNADISSVVQYSSNTSNSASYKQIKTRILSIKQQCGKLCDIDLSRSKHISKGPFYDHVEKHINCGALWNNSIFDDTSRFTSAVQKLPIYLKKYFSHDNQIPIKAYYFDNQVKEDRIHDSWGTI